MDARIGDTIANIACRWEGTNRAILGTALSALVRGAPLGVETLATRSGVTVDEVERQLHLSGAARNDRGDIIGLAGISPDDGAFRLTAPGLEARTCCALTAHASAIVRGDGVEIETSDPVEGSRITLFVTPAGIESTSPESICATMVLLEAPQKREGLFDRFCRFARYFRSTSTAARFPFGERTSLVLSPAEVHEAAALWVRVVWGIDSSRSARHRR